MIWWPEIPTDPAAQCEFEPRERAHDDRVDIPVDEVRIVQQSAVRASRKDPLNRVSGEYSRSAVAS